MSTWVATRKMSVQSVLRLGGYVKSLVLLQTLRMTDPAETVMRTAAAPASFAAFCSISASFGPS